MFRLNQFIFSSIRSSYSSNTLYSQVKAPFAKKRKKDPLEGSLLYWESYYLLIKCTPESKSLKVSPYLHAPSINSPISSFVLLLPNKLVVFIFFINNTQLKNQRCDSMNTHEALKSLALFLVDVFLYQVDCGFYILF